MNPKKSSISQPAAVTLDGSQPLTPEQIIEQLRFLRQHIPDFGPITPADALARRRAATVHVELVKGAINSVGASPFLEGAIGKDAETLRVAYLPAISGHPRSRAMPLKVRRSFRSSPPFAS